MFERTVLFCGMELGCVIVLAAISVSAPWRVPAAAVITQNIAAGRKVTGLGGSPLAFSRSDPSVGRRRRGVLFSWTLQLLAGFADLWRFFRVVFIMLTLNRAPSFAARLRAIFPKLKANVRRDASLFWFEFKRAIQGALGRSRYISRQSRPRFLILG